MNEKNIYMLTKHSVFRQIIFVMQAYSKNHGVTQLPEVAVTLCDERFIDIVAFSDAPPTVNEYLSTLGWDKVPFSNFLGERTVSRIYFGNEFCEELLPSLKGVRRIAAWASTTGMELTLVTQTFSDSGIKQLRRLLSDLPPVSEVVVNDWGVMRLIHNEFPKLEAVAGRQLCKMIKDPRLPSSELARLNPPSVVPELLGLLEKLEVRRIEYDVPPYSEVDDFKPNGMNVSVHAPYGYTLKGRICKIGSLHLKREDKFAPMSVCRKECLTYIGELRRPTKKDGHDLHTFQRGNTLFYRYSQEMDSTFLAAVKRGWINRIVLSGDWNENSCPN